MHETTITAIIVAVIGMAGGYLTYVNARRSNRHQEVSDAINQWKDLYTGVSKENERLKQEVAELSVKVDGLEKKLVEMEQHMQEQDVLHAQDRVRWEAERAILYRRLYRYEHPDDFDNTPPPANKR